ncbi:GGDEF domain-containing protein [Vibrio sp. Y2-5]|uniref:GGDEF domain-containing protein n=1 Tax=Vibrio sp. Y2-5 TaxID=2743977 RepID=UPI0016604F9D|nr:GGDEF domain-containing protein [Vibrio sp. Y2-5]MBD0785269.1 GGDEF domain-containing protein [Vibrio sp. Y2-5]
MKKNRFSLKAVLFGPLLFSMLLVVTIIYSYVRFMDSLIDDEYSRIESTLVRTTKVIRALEYSLTHYVNSDSLLPIEHKSFVEGDLCKITPAEDVSLFRSEDTRAVKPQEMSYMMVGRFDLCDENRLISRQVMKSMSLAPLISVLHGLDDYILGVHFVSKDDYVISSPDSLAKSLTSDILATLKSRPFWTNTIDNEDIITVSGPTTFDSLFFGKEILALSIPVVYQEAFQGVALVQLDIGKLIGETKLLAGKVRMVNTEAEPLPTNAYRVKPVELADLKLNHALYYELNWPVEFHYFLSNQTSSIGLVLIIYFAGVVGFFYMNTRQENSYFKRLANRDPMTGLLNRRGLEAFLHATNHNKYFSISVLDIDNFKSINDTYGHDVGDDAIRYIGEQIEKSIRDSDAVARFGGEEFVVYVTASESNQIEQIMHRVTHAINVDSKTITPSGFTVSGGVVISESAQGCDFDKLFKIADEKLYQAKTTGKNKLVF